MPCRHASRPGELPEIRLPLVRLLKRVGRTLGEAPLGRRHTRRRRPRLRPGVTMSRRDHYHDPGAPVANSIVPAVTVVVTHNQRILLQHRIDNDLWALPGGAIDIGETPPEPLSAKPAKKPASPSP